jgi:hypothetical protein
MESSYLSARLSAAIEERRLPAVFDGVGDGGWQGWAETAATQQDNGYAVRARYMTTPIETALDRSRSRADETGRGVPEHIIRHGHEGVSNDLPMLLGMSREDGSLLLPDVALAYNDNAGSSEILRTDPSTGAVTIVDMEAWLDFIQKGSKNRQRRSIAATNAIVAFGKPGGDLRMFRRVMDRIREHDMEISEMVSSESGGVGGESWAGAGSAASKVVDWLQTPPGSAVPAEIVALLV